MLCRLQSYISNTLLPPVCTETDLCITSVIGIYRTSGIIIMSLKTLCLQTTKLCFVIVINKVTVTRWDNARTSRSQKSKQTASLTTIRLCQHETDNTVYFTDIPLHMRTVLMFIKCKFLHHLYSWSPQSNAYSALQKLSTRTWILLGLEYVHFWSVSTTRLFFSWSIFFYHSLISL